MKFFKGCIILFICLTMVVAGLFYFDYDRFIPTEPLITLSNVENTSTKATIENIEQYVPDVDWSAVSIDKVEVYKGERRLDLLQGTTLIKSYQMRLGFDPIGHKTMEGDGKTPEGTYVLDWRNPQSQFYKSLHISYPNKQDIQQAKTRGVSAGGDIMLHGSAKKAIGSEGQKFHTYLPRSDWTLGCVAVSNDNMDEIWQNVKNGTTIEIFP